MAPHRLYAQTSPLPNPDESEKVVKVYPVPAVTFVNFEFQKDYDKSNSLVIYNFIGKKVYETVSMPAKLTLNVSDYYRGLYIYQVRNKTGEIIDSGKFLVTK
ncbi:T9SS type A sorting domain-containing protein [Dinghuibacter silviterrae]|uniref:T9SS type A sorting domain-containing protein n=1 Tax=Dinghuibacter silviterrae TaxID=1539049 RepID=UPI0013C32B4D|nr:T9SS type A sorting domain-containing protein [Dinghuibacter silviterrae]